MDISYVQQDFAPNQLRGTEFLIRTDVALRQPLTVAKAGAQPLARI
jgi:hypothetical protein